MLSKIIIVLVIALSSQVEAKNISNKIENKIQKSLLKRNLSGVFVKRVADKYFLEGKVDNTIDQKRAVEVCNSYSSKHISKEAKCVDLLLVRKKIGDVVFSNLRVEYKIVYNPDLTVPSSLVLLGQHFNSEASMPKIELLKAVTFNLVDGKLEFKADHEMFDQGRVPASVKLKDSFELSESGFLSGDYALSIETQAVSVPGTNKIKLKSSLSLKNKNANFEKSLENLMLVEDGEPAGVGIWLTPNKKSKKAHAILVLVTVDKTGDVNSNVGLKSHQYNN